jgi:hypothetical protein
MFLEPRALVAALSILLLDLAKLLPRPYYLEVKNFPFWSITLRNVPINGTSIRVGWHAKREICAPERLSFPSRTVSQPYHMLTQCGCYSWMAGSESDQCKYVTNTIFIASFIFWYAVPLAAHVLIWCLVPTGCSLYWQYHETNSRTSLNDHQHP